MAEGTPDSSWSLPSAPVFTPSTSNAVIISNFSRDPGEHDVSQRMLQLGRSMNIIGPKLISRERYEIEALGVGAKFEVFGHRLPEDLNDDDGLLWEGIDIRRIAFKKGRTSLKKPEELDDPSSSWVAVVSESQEVIADIRTDQQKAKQLEQVAAVVREMKALARDSLRDHRNIVKLFAWGFDMEDFNLQSLMTPILVEERAWGTFSELLITERLSAAERFNLCHDALQGLVALHRDGLYHGDINPKNILVYQEEENIVAKISDFSHSGSLPTESGEPIWYQGTKGWQAPEVYDTLPTSKSDILALEAYSFGLVLWSALGLNGKSPLASAPAVGASIPKFAHRCLDSYNLPIEIKNIAVPIVPRLVHFDNNTRFWLSGEILEDRVPISGRRLVLQTSTPINLSMDESFQQLDEFIRKRRKQNILPTHHDEVSMPPGPTNPFLKLLIEEAYVRNIAWRLASLPPLPSYNIPAFRSPDRSAYQPPAGIEVKPYNFMSLHELEQIDRERQSGVFKSLTAEKLFDIAIGYYSFDASRGLIYLRQAAAIGDVRAQAVYGALSLSATSVSGPAVPTDTFQQWTFDAMATGFTLRSKFSTLPAAQLAASQFRDNGGFNSHIYASRRGILNAQCFRMNMEPMKDYLRSSKFENYVGQPPTDGPDRNSILHFAALAGDVEMVKTITARHTDRPWYLNTKNSDNETPLLFACRGGNSEIASILLKAGAFVTTRDGDVSPLHWLFAIPPEKVDEICELMVTKGRGKLNAIAPETPIIHFPFYMPNGTPLVWAIAAGSLAAVKAISNCIVKQEVPQLEKEKCFEGAFKLAMVRHEADMMKAMIDAATSTGLNLTTVAAEAFDWSVISVPDDSDDIPVAATPLVGDWKDEVIRTLRHGTANQNLRQTLACINSAQASRVVDSDAGPSTNVPGNFMYLRKVILQHDSQGTLRLLQRYGSTYSKDDLGTALFLNIDNNWTLPSSKSFPTFMDIFRGLISAGADVNMPNPLPGGLGNTLLHIILRKYSDRTSQAAIKDTRDVVMLLLKVLRSCGADINKKNFVGMTVMDYALHNNWDYRLDEELVDMLHGWGSKSTFRMLPMSVERRIGDWNSRQLEWQQPEPERVDVRKMGGNLSLLWTDIDACKTQKDDENEDDESDESDESSDEFQEDDVISQATTLV
ncbi:hypothetical protein ABW20_dc0106545 [Dactylellina cionopaga]|nr:hypothetical protein ABW20_dc0106545 [Dactylellina cionopaga]